MNISDLIIELRTLVPSYNETPDEAGYSKALTSAIMWMDSKAKVKWQEDLELVAGTTEYVLDGYCGKVIAIYPKADTGYVLYEGKQYKDVLDDYTVEFIYLEPKLYILNTPIAGTYKLIMQRKGYYPTPTTYEPLPNTKEIILAKACSVVLSLQAAVAARNAYSVTIADEIVDRRLQAETLMHASKHWNNIADQLLNAYVGVVLRN